MYPFFESIKFENHKIFHLDWHQKRVNATFQNFYPNMKALDLHEILNEDLSTNSKLQKIKVYYDAINYKIEIQEYTRKIPTDFEIIPIDFEYEFKFTNRAHLDKFRKSSNSKEIIFCKNDHLLDSLYANLAFYRNQKWYTPSTFLLNGTTRQRLIQEKKIFEIPIKISEIQDFEKISFINALNDLEENTLKIQ